MSERRECISSILPTFRLLMHHLKGKTKDTAIIKQLQNVISKGLADRMVLCEEERFYQKI